MSPRPRTDILASILFIGSIYGCLYLNKTRPPDILALPGTNFQIEFQILSATFLFLLLVLEPLSRVLRRHLPRILNFLGKERKLSVYGRVTALIVTILASFDFLFWQAADVLGSYNGYGSSFARYKFFPLIYDNTPIKYIQLGSVGAQGLLFFLVAIISLTIFRLNKGIWNSLKDSITLFAAPFLVIFELALWYYATEDMSWHAASFLWFGGPNDGGVRIWYTNTYIFSNWFVLLLGIFLIATRLPYISRISKMILRQDNPKKEYVLQ